MGDKSLIEWCTATWNFLIGCTKKSAGCMNCYAIREAWRMMHNPNPKIARKYEGVVARDSKGELNWTGRINFDEDTLALPLRWTKPRRIFVNSLSDFFHPNVKDEWIDAAFAVMALCPQHTFQILTKHPERAVEYFDKAHAVGFSDGANDYVEQLMADYPSLILGDYQGFAAHINKAGWLIDSWKDEEGIKDSSVEYHGKLPLPNVEILTSIENQSTADERIPQLLKIPAAVRGVSAEPLLGPITLKREWLLPLCASGFVEPYGCEDETHPTSPYLDWVIVGGESGPKARPMHPDWARALRDQCVAVGVPFFFKQWGEFVSVSEVAGPGAHHYFPDGATVRRVGKKLAGRSLDGRKWNEYPSGVSNLESGITEAVA